VGELKNPMGCDTLNAHQAFNYSAIFVLTANNRLFLSKVLIDLTFCIETILKRVVEFAKIPEAVMSFFNVIYILPFNM
jgi:hypothetical protein